LKPDLQTLKAAFSKENHDEKPRIAFVGMSNVGKGFWSRTLAKEYGFKHVEIDALIGQSEELREMTKNYPGKDDAARLGNYFGMPWMPGFQEREDKYLEIEERLMAHDWPQGTILDLTGSAIYKPKQMQKIADESLVIYLETNEKGQRELFERFTANTTPKAVCWNGNFSKLPGEGDIEALARCYPVLLRTRAEEYARYADVSIPYDVHKALKAADEFVVEVLKRLA